MIFECEEDGATERRWSLGTRWTVPAAVSRKTLLISRLLQFPFTKKREEINELELEAVEQQSEEGRWLQRATLRGGVVRSRPRGVSSGRDRY